MRVRQEILGSGAVATVLCLLEGRDVVCGCAKAGAGWPGAQRVVLILCEGVPCVCVWACSYVCVSQARSRSCRLGVGALACWPGRRAAALACWRGPPKRVGPDFVLHILPGVNTSPSSAKDMPMLP